ncbi:hypothetical protein [Rhizobium lusitanum]|uniref:hypothetical protein n=1 Tax=Rhizobium lusitanum TaxID=293958 RepID=UPI001958D0BD|nr:hypothetical protein [Rhizobium lusitanum]MBM7048441.1 hypothetical protein [Rhizobium lusitanum]
MENGGNSHGARPEKRTAAIDRCGRLALPGDFYQATSAIREDVTPQAMARLIIDLFGPAAITAAAWCAFSAYCEAEEVEYRFWFAVFSRF